MNPELKSMQLQIVRLRRALVGAILLWPLSLLVLAAWHQDERKPSILRARGLIIEDVNGRERILLGAPVPDSKHRKRNDSIAALVFVGENGADRLTLGDQANPQIGGKVAKRISPGMGMTINDADGNERTGYSVMDMGRVTLGLDWKDREALMLCVDDKDSMATLMINGRTGGFERAGLYVDDQTSLLKVAGTEGLERIIIRANETGPGEILAVNPKDRSIRNVLSDGREKPQP